MSSMRGSAGSPLILISRYVANSFFLHSAVISPGTLTNGVSIVLSATHGFGALPPTIKVPFVARYACSGAAPPARAAGFVHEPLIAGSALWPNSVLAGGGIVERNEEKFTTQPICPGLRHSGIDVN